MATPRRTDRDANMRAMYEAGLTLQQIGDRYGITRERARQILRRIGVEPDAGGSAKRRAVSRAASQHAIDMKHMRRYGVNFETLKRLRAVGATRAWQEQRRNAMSRGIGWHLTLGQWWAIWDASGKWEQRGRGAGKYCLARYADRGNYVHGNVWVCEFIENCREARSHAKPPTGDNVHFLYPGTVRPWVAKHGNQSIGMFATREQAVEAKKRFLAENPDRARGVGGSGNGWTFLKRNRRRPYQVQTVCGSRRLRAFFSTQTEAEDAYRTFWLEQRGLLVRADPFFQVAA
jgi:hypothetical protein